MRYLKFYFSILILALTIVSCDTDAERKLIESLGDVDAAFSATTLKKELAISENGKYAITVFRGNAKGVVSVPITISDPSNNFSLASSTVSFAEGENKAVVEILYNYSSLTPGKNYTFSLQLDEKQLSPSKVGKLNITAKMKLEYSLLGQGTLTSSALETSSKVSIYKANGTNYYMIKDCYASGYNIEFGLDQNGNVNSFSKQEIGLDLGDGMISVSLVSSSRTEKTIDFNLKWTVSAGSYGVFKETLELP